KKHLTEKTHYLTPSGTFRSALFLRNSCETTASAPPPPAISLLSVENRAGRDRKAASDCPAIASCRSVPARAAGWRTLRLGIYPFGAPLRPAGFEGVTHNARGEGLPWNKGWSRTSSSEVMQKNPALS